MQSHASVHISPICALRCAAVIPRGVRGRLDRFVHRLVAELEGAVVHRQHVIRVHMIGHLPGLLRRRVGGDVRVVAPMPKIARSTLPTSLKFVWYAVSPP